MFIEKLKGIARNRAESGELWGEKQNVNHVGVRGNLSIEAEPFWFDLTGPLVCFMGAITVHPDTPAQQGPSKAQLWLSNEW